LGFILVEALNILCVRVWAGGSWSDSFFKKAWNKSGRDSLYVNSTVDKTVESAMVELSHCSVIGSNSDHLRWVSKR
jgi:hypothetical protein